jgi:hypothetical protein
MRMELRLITFLAGCGLLAMWAYPQIDFTYSSWSNQANSWLPFKTIHSRVWLMNVDFGTESNFSMAHDEMLPKNQMIVPYWGYSIERHVKMAWLTQFAQSALILIVAAGLFWVVKARGSCL